MRLKTAVVLLLCQLILLLVPSYCSELEPELPEIPELIDISDAKVVLSDGQYIYNGSEQKVKIESVELNGQMLELDTDYTVSGDIFVNAGDYTDTLTIEGIGKYTGVKVLSYQVAAQPADDVELEFSSVMGEQFQIDLEPFIVEGGELGEMLRVDAGDLISTLYIESDVLYYEFSDEGGNKGCQENDGKSIIVSVPVISNNYLPYNINVTLTAIAPEIKYQISFDAGKGGSGEMTAVNVKDGELYKLPECKFKAPKDHVFDKWQIPDSVDRKGDSIVVTQDITLKAIWKPVMCKIMFDGNGASGSMENVSVKKNSTYILPDSSFIPPSGKIFSGWGMGNVGSTVVITDNTILLAQWVDANITIKFNSNTQDAETVDRNIQVNPATGIASIKLPEIPSFKNTGFKQTGWKITSGHCLNSTKSFFRFGEEVQVRTDTEFKAVWEKLPKVEYSLIYDANGGNNAPAKMTAHSLEGVPVTVMVSYLKPEADSSQGKVQFAGWSDKPDGEVKYHGSDKITLNGNRTLYAVWEEIPKAETNLTWLWITITAVLGTASGVAAVVFYNRYKKRKE